MTLNTLYFAAKIFQLSKNLFYKYNEIVKDREAAYLDFLVALVHEEEFVYFSGCAQSDKNLRYFAIYTNLKIIYVC